MNNFNSKPEKATAENLEIIESLLKYPSLEKVFGANSPDGYEKTKRTMSNVIAELERVIRRGTKHDAERVQTILEAYRTALNFLDELEEIRRRQIRK